MIRTILVVLYLVIYLILSIPVWIIEAIVGIFNKKAISIVGVGAVVNFDTMKGELDGIPKELHKNLLVDVRAHLIMPYHCLLDGAEESKRSEHDKIGTTKRGIGPCYSDKAARTGIRVGELLDLESLRAHLERILPKKNRELEYYGPHFAGEGNQTRCD